MTKTDKPDGKPVLCQKTFSSVFLAVFYTVKLRSLLWVFGALYSWSIRSARGLFATQTKLLRFCIFHTMPHKVHVLL